MFQFISFVHILTASIPQPPIDFYLRINVGISAKTLMGTVSKTKMLNKTKNQNNKEPKKSLL